MEYMVASVFFHALCLFVVLNPFLSCLTGRYIVSGAVLVEAAALKKRETKRRTRQCLGLKNQKSILGLVMAEFGRVGDVDCPCTMFRNKTLNLKLANYPCYKKVGSKHF
jgi:hypothetical protein